MPASRQSLISRDGLWPLRRGATMAWLSWLLSIVLLLAQRQLRVVHPTGLLFALLLLATLTTTVSSLLCGLWRLLRGPRRGRALLWTIAVSIPVLFWVVLGIHVFLESQRRHILNTVPHALMHMAVASLMSVQAGLSYPDPLESEHVIMYYGEGCIDAQRDIAAMNQHVARMVEVTGLPLRSRIYWVRGPLLSFGYCATYGLALGSEKGPANEVDKHELAHVFLYQHCHPDTDPPALLSEGWAEAQSMPVELLAAGAYREFWQLGSYDLHATIVEQVGPDLTPLQELTHPVWYHQHWGPVYPVGGAFTEFLLRRYGARRFVELYLACRPGTFEDTFRRVYGAELITVEKQFWKGLHDLR